MENNSKQIDKVVSITVTYNRTRTLKHTIDALMNQTYPIFKVIVIDNNSNHEEQNILKDLIVKHTNLEVVWLNENLGGAGGFEAGMETALEKYDPDWYWIMDDDAYPNQDCLERLLSEKARLTNIGCLCPSIYGIDNEAYQMYHHKILSGYLMKENSVTSSYSDLEDVTNLDANAFVGPLVSKEAVKSVGVADGELFIYGDDTEYTFRVSRNMSVYLIKNAIIKHQDPPNSNSIEYPSSWWKEYYMIRNKILFINKYQDRKLRKLLAKGYILYSVCRRMISTLVSPKYKKFRKIRIRLLYNAWYHGFKNMKGKTLDPKSYINSINEMQQI